MIAPFTSAKAMVNYWEIAKRTDDKVDLSEIFGGCQKTWWWHVSINGGVSREVKDLSEVSDTALGADACLGLSAVVRCTFHEWPLLASDCCLRYSRVPAVTA